MSAVVNLRRYSNGILGPGDRAPEFRLKVTLDQGITLSELRGRPVILAFYPPTGVRYAATR